ncbi:MAG TPA: amino acid adenylation domain-containing protein, partial [Kofleriaceae bacterium]|nr:amino acid adenylation domain-containing protein [Kofleriaceae bacterium]
MNYPQRALTACQRDIWTAESRSPGSSQYNTMLWERLDGVMDLELLRTCLVRALRRHDATHLRFDEVDGAPYQWVDAQLAERIAEQVEVVDFVGQPDSAAAVAAWRQDALDRPFRFPRGPLVRGAVLRESTTLSYLFVLAHHLVVDACSLQLLSEEIFSDYERTASGRPAAPGPAQSFLGAVDSDTRYRASERHEADRTFYREYLSGVSPALFARKQVNGNRRTGHHAFTLSSTVIKRIREIGSSPYAFITAALATYLTRIHRVDEMVLGIPLLNRQTPEERTIVGEFANTLPLRVRAPRETTMRELAAQAQAGIRDVQKRERLSLGDVLRELPASSLSSRQLFDVTIAYLRYPPQHQIPGVARSTMGITPVHDQDTLAVMMHTFGDFADVEVELDYSRDVFDDDFPIQAVAGHLRELIGQALDRPDRPISELAMLTARERDWLARHARGPRIAYADATLHALFERRAALVPDQPAVIDAGGASLSYAELDARANQVARALRADGVSRDDRIAVALERGPALLPALLGVLKAGAAYVPVDVDYPPERIRFMLADSGAKVVLAGDAADSLPAAPGVTVHRVPELFTGSAAPVDPIAGPVAGRDLAYVIYTSGSSGRPKGAAVEHHSVVNRLAWMQRAYPIGSADVLLQKTPISFDVSVWELFWWAIEGARLALLPVGGEKDPRQILRAIAANSVSVIHFVPSMLGPFLDLLEEAPEAREQARSLRHVFASGEALPPHRVEQLNRIFGAMHGGVRGNGGVAPTRRPRLVNLYGPTEATVDVSYFDCPVEPGLAISRVPIGRPIDNTELHVLGPTGEPQPMGAAGELCIAGVGLARGYHERPELSAARFVPAPGVLGGRMYRTGDLARVLADGAIEYLGRIDDQVKIRGNRVELGEVQDRLAHVPGIRAAAVVDHSAPGQDTQLIAYYVADGELDPLALRAQLAQSLPGFMIPSHFRRVEQIPLTPSGKLDRRALPALQAAGAFARRPPTTELEAAIAAVWAEVLNIDFVGIDDNYFALGGDSLLMLKIRAKAERRGVHFALSDLVQHPTVAELALRATLDPARA